MQLKSTNRQLETTARETRIDNEIVHLSTRVEILEQNTEAAAHKMTKKKRMKVKNER